MYVWSSGKQLEPRGVYAHEEWELAVATLNVTRETLYLLEQEEINADSGIQQQGWQEDVEE